LGEKSAICGPKIEKRICQQQIDLNMISHPFDSLMELDTQYIRLDCAALHLARDAYPRIALPTYLSRLDAIANHVAEMRPGLSATLRYEAMRRVLVEGHGLRGNEDDYYDPANSYLNRVLDRGLGIPISLSIIWLEVARRLKWRVAGLGLPGHFIIRFDDDERFVLVDPFREGRTLAIEDCRRILDYYFEGKVRFSAEFLRPVSVRCILARSLYNLRNIYIANHDWDNAARVLRRLASVEPSNVRHLNELAELLYRRGEIETAWKHLSAYMMRRPGTDGQFRVRERLAHIEAIIASMN
jgi:regulator of sirC expression with transglutaminase-like and TPR domain